MNERIKELAEESYNEFYNIHIDLKKFAELIVRECAKVSINNGCGDFVDIEQKLFEHFGVEE